MQSFPAGTFFPLVPWVVFLPLAGLFINLIIGRRSSEKTVGWIASLASGGAFLVACLLFLSLQKYPDGQVVPFADWITVGKLSINWAFRVDTLSVTMMLVVSGVGTLIHIYSIGYMHEDVRLQGDPGRYARFFIYLNLFIAMMMILVSAESYLMTFVGWEGVGLCSYLLIGFWFEKGKDGEGNAIAAKKAFLANRVGDFGFLAAMFLIFTTFGSLNFSQVFLDAGRLPPSTSLVDLAILLFLLLAVTGKSAQIPLFVWLPDAMAGPTPVSALIHAATMVTAGVYLVARSAPLFFLNPAAQQVVAVIGALTAIFAATIAVGQYDIKKVLAYSTISQLGFMVAAVGMGAYTAGMFHLVTHAFFKALLFLASGAVIQGVEFGHQHAPHEHGDEPVHFDPQDMRTMGGLGIRLPTTFRVYVIGALALAGIPPLAGFFSKDEILAFAAGHSPFVLVCLLGAAFLTAFYMGRQVWMVFYGAPRSDAAAGAVECGPSMRIPLMVLAGLALVGGAINLPTGETFAKWLEHTIRTGQTAEFSWLIAGISVAAALLGIALSWMLYARKPLHASQPDPLRRWIGPLMTALERKWWIDEIYDVLFLTPYKDLSEVLAGPVDGGLIDGLVNGSGRVTAGLSNGLKRLQNGLVRTYALFVLLGVAAILGFLIFK
jgi:NADH-quinone oxidoreductase subunit L